MDTLRLNIAEAGSEAGGGFQVQIYVNDVEMTSAGAGLGMDPYDVLVPVNRFAVSDGPETIPVARCGCGVYGCGMTDATIVREGKLVSWDWQAEVPMSRPAVFDVAAYEQEIRRIGDDHSWEPPERTVGRLVLTTVDSAELPNDLRFDWVGNDWRDASRFQVCLRAGNSHQIFIDFDWQGRSPQALATEIRRVLVSTKPGTWDARWHSIQPGGGPPEIASTSWRQARL